MEGEDSGPDPVTLPFLSARLGVGNFFILDGPVSVTDCLLFSVTEFLLSNRLLRLPLKSSVLSGWSENGLAKTKLS